MDKSKNKLIFTDRSVGLVLEALGKETDIHGYVVDKATKQYVKDTEGFCFKPDELIGIYKNAWITESSVAFMVGKTKSKKKSK